MTKLQKIVNNFKIMRKKYKKKLRYRLFSKSFFECQFTGMDHTSKGIKEMEKRKKSKYKKGKAPQLLPVVCLPLNLHTISEYQWSSSPQFLCKLAHSEWVLCLLSIELTVPEKQVVLIIVLDVIPFICVSYFIHSVPDHKIYILPRILSLIIQEW